MSQRLFTKSEVKLLLKHMTLQKASEIAMLLTTILLRAGDDSTRGMAMVALVGEMIANESLKVMDAMKPQEEEINALIKELQDASQEEIN